MAKRIIKTGITANDSGGDSIRLAFQKVNDNFTELYSGLPMLSVGSVPPTGPHIVGEQWWDSTDGNSYIWYDGSWVPSTASVSDQTKNVRTNTGNSINIDFQADGVITTTQTTDINIAFSNYTVGSRVKVVVATSSSSFKVNLGVLATKSSNSTTVAQATVVPSTIMLEYVCTTTQASGVFVTVSTTGSSSPSSFSGSYTDLTNKPSIPSAYTLPTASASILGGIKIGSGLSIDGSGVVTASSGSVSSLVNGSKTVVLASNGALTLSDTGIIQAQGKNIYALAVTDDGTTNTTVNNYIRVSINWQALSSVWPNTGALVTALAQGGTLTGPTNDNAIFTATITSAEYVSGNVFKIYTNRTGNMKRSGRYYIENVPGALDSIAQLQVGPDSLIRFPSGGGLRSENKTVTSSANGPITDLQVTNLAIFPEGAALTVSNEPYGAPVGLNLSTSPSQTSIVNVLPDSIYLQVNEQSKTTSYTNAIQITKDTLTLGNVGGQNKWVFGTDGNLTLPQGGVITSDGVAAVIVKAPSGSQAVLANNAGYNAILAQDQDVRVATSPDAGSTFNTWNFGTDGNLTLPDRSVIASYKPVTVIAQTSTTRTINDQASAAYILFTETVDTANAYANGVFTAPYTGYYQFNVSIYFSTSVTLNSGSFFYIVSSDGTKTVTIMQDAWSGRYLHYSTVVQATAGDTITCFVLRNASGANIELASGCRLTIHRVSIS